MKLKHFIKKYFKVQRCKICSSTFNVKKRRLNTAYVDDKCNFLTSCEYCYQEAYSYYADLWSDFYSSVL